MAETKSTLNKSLPKASTIRFCTGLGKGMSIRLGTGESGKVGYYVGFKQPSKRTYGWQVQRRYRYMYNEASAKKKGADWSKWSAWKQPFSGLSWIAKNATTDADTWLKANKGLSKKSDYLYACDKVSWKMPADYDAICYEYRVRSYDPAKKRHGEWVTQRLYVYRRPFVDDEEVRPLVGGGFVLLYNYKARGDKYVDVTSVKDSSGTELLKASVSSTPSTSTMWTPPAGYTIGATFVDVGKLVRAVVPGEVLTIKAKLSHLRNTSAGECAKTLMFTDQVTGEPKTVTVNNTDPNIVKPRLAITIDSDKRTLLVEAYKGESDDIVTSADASLTYKYRGSNYTLSPISKEVNTSNKISPVVKALFIPPLNTDLTVKVSFSNKQYATIDASATVKVDSDGFVLSKADNSRHAALDYNQSIERTYSKDMESEIPYGRSRPVVFYGGGRTCEINLTGYAFDEPGVSVSNYRSWLGIRNNIGVYKLRSPDGTIENVAVSSVNLSQESERIVSVSVDMTEVSV